MRRLTLRTPVSRAQYELLLVDVLELACEGSRELERFAQHWPDQDDDVRPQDKYIIEAALLIQLCRRLPPDSARVVAGPLDRLTREVYARATSQRVIDAVRAHPRAVWGLGLAYVLLREPWCYDDRAETVFARAWATNQVEMKERAPFRVLEVLWARSLSETVDQGRVDAACRLSTAASGAHPIYMTRLDCYAVTHALWYATDFGRRPAMLHEFADAKTRVDEAIAWTLGTRDFDILAELVMASFVLGSWRSPYAVLARHVIEKTIGELGFLPGPNFSQNAARSRPPEAREAYTLLHLYHTQFVMGMLCALVLGNDGGEYFACSNARPATPKVTAGSPLAVLLGHVGRMHEFGTAADWRSALAGTSLDELDAAGVVADAALTYLARTRNLRELLRLLEVVVDLDLPETSTAHAAAGFLQTCLV